MHDEALDASFEPFSREPEYVEVNRPLARGLPLAASTAILDLACGTGALTGLVLEELDRPQSGRRAVAGMSAPAVRVVGVDLSWEALGLARRHLEAISPSGERVALLQASCDRLPLADQTMDAALMANAIQLFDDKDRLLREVGRVLRPGGAFAFNTSFYAGAYLPGTEGFYLTWVEEALRYVIRKDMELRRQGRRGIPRQKGAAPPAFSRRWLSRAEYEELLRRNGFRVTSIADRVVNLTRHSLEAIGGYAGLASVLLSGYPSGLACEALQRSAGPALEAAQLANVPRGWLECIAVKDRARKASSAAGQTHHVESRGW
jgi:ubiquinone/menaquinone biosynthesis C-methylase UbiE